MTVVNSTSEDTVFESIYEKNAGFSKNIVLNDDALFFFSLDRPGRGAQHLGRKHRIKELYFNQRDWCIYAGFLAKDRSGSCYKYVQLAKLEPIFNKRGDV